MASNFTQSLLTATLLATSALPIMAAEASTLGESSLRDLEQIQAAAGIPSVPTVNDLTRIQSETLMLQAQNARNEEARRLEASNAPEPREQHTPAREFVPVVARVTGSAASPTAYLLLGDGSIVPTQAGVSIAGGYKVLEVSARQVLVQKDGETFVLGFATTAPGVRRPIAPVGVQQ